MRFKLLRFITLTCLLLAICGAVLAQSGRTLSGVVRGPVPDQEEPQPLAGAAVLLLDGESGAMLEGVFTDEEGRFSLNAPEGQPLKLKISYVTYLTQVIVVEDGKNEYEILLEEDLVGIEEIVVTALNVKEKKSHLGYAVQEIEGDDLRKSARQNPVQSLAGRVAGAQVIQSSGTPGASSSIYIRGGSSILGENQPLFVVDGVPIDNQTLVSGVYLDGDGNLQKGVDMANRVIDLNPDNIESINVLKGPAAAALYGTRAGAGAVVVTTKKGKEGEGNYVTWTSAMEVSSVNKLPELNQTYAQGEYAFNEETGTREPTYMPGPNGPTTSWGPAVSTLGDAQVYDQTEDFFETGTGWSNTIAYTGQGENSRFRIALGNYTQQGVIPNTDFQRNNVRLTFDSRFSKNFSVLATGAYVQSGGNRAQKGSNLSGVMVGLLRTPPTFDNSEGYENPDGTQRAYSPLYDNPYWTVNKNSFEDNVSRFLGNTTLKYEPLPWLSIINRSGSDIYTDQQEAVYAPYSNEFPTGLIIENQYNYRELYNDLMANANFRFGPEKAWGLKFTLGNNLNERRLQRLYAQGQDLAVPGFYNLANAGDVKAFEEEEIIRIISFFGFARLQYKDLATLNITGRHETSSTFGPNNRSLFYPSANAAFVFTELPFLKDSDFKDDIMPYGKIRAAYSVVGIEPPPYSTRTYFSTPFVRDGFVNGLVFPFLGAPGYTQSDVQGEDNLTPELVTGVELGADLRFLDNRLGLDVTWYRQTTSDLIFPVPVAPSSGFNAVIDNSGELVNRGWEIILRATPVKFETPKGNFQWDFFANFTRNRSELTELTDGVDNLILGGFVESDIRAVVGQPYGQIYGNTFARDEQGNILIDDFNPDNPVILLESEVIGNTQPDFMLGIGNEVSFENLTLSFLVDIRQGGDIWNGTQAFLNRIGASKSSADERGQQITIEGVNLEGQPVTATFTKDDQWYQRYESIAGDNAQFVEDGSWVRLREVGLSYSFTDLALLKYIDRIDLSVIGYNLLLFTDYSGVDPETNLYGAGSNAVGLDYFNMPNTRSVTMGVNVTFR